MTTTMVRMEDTVQLVKERNMDTKVIIGGAVVTENSVPPSARMVGLLMLSLPLNWRRIWFSSL